MKLREIFRLFSPRGANSRLARLRRSIDGVAAVEFAILGPLMALLFFGSTEVTQAVMASRKASLMARTLSDLVSQRSMSTGSALPTCTASQPCMDDTTMQTIFGAASTIMAPYPVSTTTGGVTTYALNTTVSAVDFTAFTSTPPAGTDLTKIWVPDSTNPNGGAVATASTKFSTSKPGYEAKVRWVKTGPGPTNAMARTCGPLTPDPSNSDKPVASKLPYGLYAPGSLIIADVQYAYTPVFRITSGVLYGWGTSTIPTTNTTYMRPRNTTGSCNSTGGSWICYPSLQTGACASSN